MYYSLFTSVYCTHHITYCTIALSAAVVKSLMTYWSLSSPLNIRHYNPDDLKRDSKLALHSILTKLGQWEPRHGRVLSS